MAFTIDNRYQNTSDIFRFSPGYIPRSDPEFPPENECLHCRVPASVGQKLYQCSRCKLAKFCGQECLTAAYSSNHKADCAALKKYSGPNKLKSEVRRLLSPLTTK